MLHFAGNALSYACMLSRRFVMREPQTNGNIELDVTRP